MIRNIFIMFILDESEIYYMSDIRKLLEQDRLEFEADQKIKNLDNIVQALRNGRLSIFAGAGLSASSGYVNWKQLIKPMSDYLGLNINTDLTMIAQYYENECTREGLNRAILNEFSKVPTKNDNMEILASLPIDTYWTTNYDSIIEDTLLRNGKTVDVIYEQIQYKNYTPGRDAVVYKMHGDKKFPDRAVISKTDYELYDVYRSVFSKGLVMELITKTVLFIGFGFADPNLDRFISIVRHTFEKYSPPTHYCFMRSVSYEDYLDEKGNLTRQKKIEFEQDKKLQDLKIRSMKGYGIHTILVDDFTQITAMLNYIRDKYTLNKVFISGALDPKSPHSYRGYFNRKPRNSKFKNGEWFIMQLAKRIIDDGYDIVNGFGVGIGNYIVSGAYMGGSQRGGSDYVSKHLTIQPLISVEQQERDKKDEVRRKLIRDCGTVIFLFGKTLYEDNNSKKDELDKDGTYLEYEIAVEEAKNIIPVGATGLTSRYIYNEVYRENKHKSFIDRLNKENINSMQLIDDIMSMIESEKHKKEQTLKKTLMKDAFSNDDTSGYDVYNQINVFVSFHFAGANQQSRLILSVLDDEPGINPVKESGKISDESKIEQWIDKKIKSTSVTILILSKGMTKSIWVGREIQKSIEENNKFVLIDISSGQYDKDFLSQYKIGSKSLDEIYPIHSVENCNKKEGFTDVGKWVRDAVADI